MGHKVVLIPPSYIKPYVKRGKNDAIGEAMSRPGMRFAAVKGTEQQATLMLHRTREMLIKQRTRRVTTLREHLGEFGVAEAKGIDRVDELLGLAENDTTLPKAVKAAVDVLTKSLEGLGKATDELDKKIASAHTQSEMIHAEMAHGLEPVLAAKLNRRKPRLMLPQNPYNLLFWKPAPLHVRLLLGERTLT